MIGKPKFKIGDWVSFEWKGDEIEGEVWVVDAYGTFFDDSDVSYDIMVEKENMLYKHFTEKLVKPYISTDLSHENITSSTKKGVVRND